MTKQLSKSAKFRVLSFSDLVDATPARRLSLIEGYHYLTLWTYAANVLLGLWLITAPHLYAYGSRSLATSDTISGALAIACECLAFAAPLYVLRWLTPLIGVWLLFAPLIFWAPQPATYLLDTLIGCLFIVFALVIPGTPGKAGLAQPGPDMPPGWTYNPSSWIRRWLGIALALLGFFISRYLAARQLGYAVHAFDPFFGGGTDKVIHSVISKSFPISDAGFGSVAYILEVIAGFMGSRDRWRTAPWVVTTFAVLVVPLGVTSIVLVMLQPTVVGAWCGLCLIAAAGLLASVPLAVHEIIAMGLFLRDGIKRGKNGWELFWLGGTIDGAGSADPDRKRFTLAQRWVASVQGVSVPWTLAAQIALGIWLMARPSIFHSSTLSADCDYMLGALVVTVAAVATAEVTRTARLLNIVFGLALIACALLSVQAPMVFWSDILSGAIVAVTSIPKGELYERYDGWDRFIK